MIFFEQFLFGDKKRISNKPVLIGLMGPVTPIEMMVAMVKKYLFVHCQWGQGHHSLAWVSVVINWAGYKISIQLFECSWEGCTETHAYLMAPWSRYQISQHHVASWRRLKFFALQQLTHCWMLQVLHLKTWGICRNFSSQQHMIESWHTLLDSNRTKSLPCHRLEAVMHSNIVEMSHLKFKSNYCQSKSCKYRHFQAQDNFRNACSMKCIFECTG